MRTMNRILSLLCILILASSYAIATGASPDSINWKSVAIAWKTYIANPSNQNGERFYNMLPIVRDRSIAFDSSSYYSIYGNLGELGKLVLQQKRVAVRIAFRLLSVCDADFCETLDQYLGGLIRRNPTMFLEEFSNHRNSIGHLGGLVGNLGDDFVDQEAKSNRECRLRIQALKGVRKASLRSIRDECINELESQIR